MDSKFDKSKILSDDEEKKILFDVKTHVLVKKASLYAMIFFFGLMAITFFTSCFNAINGESFFGLCFASLVSCYYGHAYIKRYKESNEIISNSVNLLNVNTLMKLIALRKINLELKPEKESGTK